jgi:hypothetical protein
LFSAFCSEEEGIPTRSDLFRNAAKKVLMRCGLAHPARIIELNNAAAALNRLS